MIVISLGFASTSYAKVIEYKLKVNEQKVNISGKEFSDSAERAITIFDEVELSASDEVRDLMLDAFYKSTVLELHFWNDSYNQVVFDAFV
jgi:thiaminase